MSQENVEIVRRVFEARNQWDWETMRELAAPDIEVDFSRSMGPWVGVYRGFEALERLRDEGSEVLAGIRWEAEEFIDAGEAVVAPARFYSRGRGSGIETVSRGAAVFWLAEGKLSRYVLYQNRAAALEAVGLRE